MGGLSGWMTLVEVSREMLVDPFQYCSASGEEYVKRLAALDPLVVASLVCRNEVDDRAMCFAKGQLSVDFRYLEKAHSSYWSSFVCNRGLPERQLGMRFQCMTQNNISSGKRVIACVQLTVGWSRIEVPMGCYAELLLALTYKRCALIAPKSGR